jgi:hypothetical protein
MPITVAGDLRALFGPARDQRGRPTCLAFAASDFHAALRDGWIPLSCEAAFYHAQRRAGHSPHVGATLDTMLDGLRVDGQPTETDWPYLTAVPNDLAVWAPPEKLGAIYYRTGERRGQDIDEIFALLGDGRPALLLMMLSDAFYKPDARGVVVAPAGEGPDSQRRHAVVAVAHGTNAGERVVLVRNSWGHGWAINGHAWLPESFLAPRLLRVAVLNEDSNVLAH